MSIKSLDELIKTAPPPKEPVDRGINEDIAAIEKQIGTKLPSDYLEYIYHYGDCLWFEHVWILSPFKPTDYSLWSWHEKNIPQLTIL